MSFDICLSHLHSHFLCMTFAFSHLIWFCLESDLYVLSSHLSDLSASKTSNHYLVPIILSAALYSRPRLSWCFLSYFSISFHLISNYCSLIISSPFLSSHFISSLSLSFLISVLSPLLMSLHLLSFLFVSSPLFFCLFSSHLLLISFHYLSLISFFVLCSLLIRSHLWCFLSTLTSTPKAVFNMLCINDDLGSGSAQGFVNCAAPVGHLTKSLCK